MFGIKKSLFGFGRKNDPKPSTHPSVYESYGLPKESFYDRAWTAFWNVVTFPTIILPLYYNRQENEQFALLERDYSALGREKFVEMYKSTGYAYYLLPKFLKKKDRVEKER